MDAPSIYEIPLVLHDEGLDRVVCQTLAIDGDRCTPSTCRGGRSSCPQVSASERPVRIGVVGKYVNLPDAYLSVVEALRHAGFHHGAKVEVDWIQAETVPDLLATDRMLQLDGIVIPGGFGERGIEGKIDGRRLRPRARDPVPRAVPRPPGHGHRVRPQPRRARRRQLAASSTPLSPHPVIDLMDDQHKVVDMGGTMRLGSYVGPARAGLAGGRGLRRPTVVSERHRHRYEVNPRYRARLEEAGLRCSGTSADGLLVEFVELPGHPFWVGTQAHPEFKSRPDRPHPLFRELLARGARAGPKVACPASSPSTPTSVPPPDAAGSAGPPLRGRHGFRHLGDESVRGMADLGRQAPFEAPDGDAPSPATWSAIPAPWRWCR